MASWQPLWTSNPYGRCNHPLKLAAAPSPEQTSRAKRRRRREQSSGSQSEDVVDLVDSSDDDSHKASTMAAASIISLDGTLLPTSGCAFDPARFQKAIRELRGILLKQRQAPGSILRTAEQPAGGIKRPRKTATAVSGTGYQGSVGDVTAAAQGIARAASQSAKNDADIVAILRELRRSFPEGSLDQSTAESLLAAICCGPPSSPPPPPRPSLVSWLAAFLHGSLMDLSERRKLAGVAISLVCNIASHADLRAALLYVASESPDSNSTWQRTAKQNNPNWNRLDASLAASAPPASCVYSRLLLLAQQSSVFLQGTTSQASVHVLGDADAQQLRAARDLSSLVVGAAADVERVFGVMARGAHALAAGAAGVSASSAAAPAATGSAAVASAYEREMMPFAYATVPLLAQQHVLAAKLQVPPPSSVRQLMRVQKELARASSEFVKYGATVLLRSDEGRCNVLKALISGPRDTPYAFGLWGFDIALPPSYPDKCPLVKFTTTGGGTVRMNPNLYADGKVCLSLLGTWQGPGWDPKHSTLGQVLMSIQALILCEQPIRNEPCYSNRSAAMLAVRMYNQHLRLATMQHGILPFIRNAPPGFEDSVHIYWRHHAADVQETVASWLKEAELLAMKHPAPVSAPAPAAASSAGTGAPGLAAYELQKYEPLMQVFMQQSWVQACCVPSGLLTQMRAAAAKITQALQNQQYI